VGIELIEFLGWHPQFQDRVAANPLHGITTQEVGIDVKSGDVADAGLGTFQSRAFLIA
jgi:hypothetical protein